MSNIEKLVEITNEKKRASNTLRLLADQLDREYERNKQGDKEYDLTIPDFIFITVSNNDDLDIQYSKRALQTPYTLVGVIPELIRKILDEM